MKPWYQSKTIWLAVIQGALGVLAAVTATNPDVATIGSFAVVKSVLDIVLRLITETPVGSRDQSEPIA